jgi:hypothetical protein
MTDNECAHDLPECIDDYCFMARRREGVKTGLFEIAVLHNTSLQILHLIAFSIFRYIFYLFVLSFSNSIR